MYARGSQATRPDAIPAQQVKMDFLRFRQAVWLYLLLCSLSLWSACSQNGATGDAAQAAMSLAVPVTVATVAQKTVPVEVRVIGNGEAYSTVVVRSQVDGQLQSAHFLEGQDVNEGDLLFTIDPRPYESTLKQAEANLARDLAQENNARIQADRAQKLYEGGLISREQYDQFHANAGALEAAVRADQAAVENAKIQLGYCSIRSPLAGRTGKLLVHVGNIVKTNDTALVEINQISPLYVSFTVPEQHLQEIKQYQARGKLKVEAMPSNDETRSEQGVLTFFNNTVDSTTGSILLRAAFQNAEKRLWPGQFVNVVLRLTTLPNAAVAPTQAVQAGQAGHYVFVVGPNLTVESRPVVTGPAIGGETVIEKGLQPGDKVVTDGQLRLFPGAKVEVKASLESDEVGSPKAE
jgi:membrane fusion protein, multidrug efflux system